MNTRKVSHSGSMTFVGRGKFRRLGSGAVPFGVSTKSRARVAVEPATFWAVHWYQAASENLAHGISKVEAPLPSLDIRISGPGVIGTPSCQTSSVSEKFVIDTTDRIRKCYLLPRDTWNRRADCACHKDNGFSFLHARCNETFYKFRRDYLFLLDNVQIALTGGFASFIPSNACYYAGVGTTHICNHQWIVTGFIYEDFMSHVIGDLLTIYVPSNFGIRTTSYATVKSENDI